MTEPVAQTAPVALVDPTTGRVVEADAVNLATLQDSGYRLASDEEVAAERDQQLHGEGLGNELAAFGEGALSGATLGLSDVAARAIAPEYAEGLAKRRELNPVSAGLGEAAGLVGSTLLTGGESLLAKGAAAATAPARGLIGLGEAATAGAARVLGAEAATGVLGRAARQGAALAFGGATEGVLFGAAKVATDDFLHDHEITAERILAGAKTGALTGAVLGAGMGAGGSLLESGAAKVWPALKRAIDSEAIDDFVAERAYKAALGGRNLKDVQRSERFGGPEEIGKTLLQEGVVTPTSTIDDIARTAGERAEAHGSRIGEIVDELDAITNSRGTGPQRIAFRRRMGQDLWQRLDDDVIAPLKASPLKRDVGEALEGRLGYLREALTRTDELPLTFRDLWTLRKDFDDRLRWDQAPAPFAAPNPTMEAMRDARRTFEEYWQEIGDKVATNAGFEGLLPEFRAAKRSYSHLKHAEEIAEKAIARGNANRMLSPSDYGFGAAMALGDAASGGGVSLGTMAYGLASGAVHKYFRERGAAMFAGTMYRLRGAPKLVQDARAGEQAVEDAATGLVASLLDRAAYAGKRAKSTFVASAARSLSSPETYEAAARKAAELTDPSSPRRQEMRRHSAALRVEYPELADAMDAKTQALADFLDSKVGGISAKPKQGDPFGHLRKPRHDPAKALKLARYVEVATSPGVALERIGKGDLRREDLEVLQTLYPRLHQRVRDSILMNLSKVDRLPSYEQRLKLGLLLGVPTDPSMRPERIAAMQAVIKSGAYGAAQAQENSGALAPSQRRAPRVANLYETGTERAQKI